jgi:hypothetical protein
MIASCQYSIRLKARRPEWREFYLSSPVDTPATGARTHIRMKAFCFQDIPEERT